MRDKDWRAAVVGPKNSYAERASSGTKQESGVSKLNWNIDNILLMCVARTSLSLRIQLLTGSRQWR